MPRLRRAVRGKEFTTRTRIMKHLRRRWKCLEVVRQIEQLMDDEEVLRRREDDPAAVADLKAQGHVATKALVPARRKICLKLADAVEMPQPEEPVPALLDFEEEEHFVGTARPTRPIGLKVLYILHLFSGRRRQDDFQHYVERFVQDCRIIVLLIDVQMTCPNSR